MKKLFSIFILLVITIVLVSNTSVEEKDSPYQDEYITGLANLETQLAGLSEAISDKNISNDSINSLLIESRLSFKSVDIWLRYFDPIAYKKINGPLPVEWETEVFEKWEKPYKRVSSGFTIGELYWGEESHNRDSLHTLFDSSISAVRRFQNDSFLSLLGTPDHFFYANRLFILNLATIYTTGFECPNTDEILPELIHILKSNREHYIAFNKSFSSTRLTSNYLDLYNRTIDFVDAQPQDFQKFDHFSFIQLYVNPLFTLNQKLILEYGSVSTNLNDFSLNNNVTSIFDKNLYTGQEKKGVFKGLEESTDLNRLYDLGEKLFNDPILSVNNKRSCASCHKPTEFFNDTSTATSLQLDGQSFLNRNTPSLVNSLKNHLLALDGRHYSPISQAKEVIANPEEMGSNESEILKKVLAIKYYKKEFKHLSSKVLDNRMSANHIYSALIAYYGLFDSAQSTFDQVMTAQKPVSNDVQSGFNLFMSKGECATCHFAPMFNGVKPPYVSSEFEVIGTPIDTSYSKLSEDRGRGSVHQVSEMQNAFRTPTLRNTSFTMPYMHNGIFRTLDEVLEFYNQGGGQGKGLKVSNQTLNAEKLNLTSKEKTQIIAFIRSLDEELNIPNNSKLPKARGKLKNRKTEY
ncbi:MAG: cytochrome C peroxidase [Bacteroidetes bacterium]|nr:MAG: cytochrome C peroxidase [Bacteroidota bacterium]